MASYKDIQGFNIQNLSSDPVPFAQEKANNPYVGSWSSGGTVNTGRNTLSSSGTLTANLIFGGETTGAPGNVANTESYNGSTWTEVNDLNTALRSTAGAGTSTSALRVNGYDPAPASPVIVNVVESWNGTSWTEIAELNTARMTGAASGTSNTSILMFGGLTALPSTSVTSTESWNGTSWTEVNDLNTATYFHAGTGTQTSALSIAGYAPGRSTKTESWNGTSWTEVNDLNLARNGTAASGTDNTNALVFAGDNPGAPTTVNTESWDGTSWAEVNNLSIAKYRLAGSPSGSSTSALASTGFNSSDANTTSSEEWTFSGIPPTTPAAGYTDAIVGQIYYNTSTGSFKAIKAGGAPIGTWASGGNLNTAREQISGAGTRDAALAFSGSVPPVTAITESYNGTSWTEVNDLNTARRSGGGFGTQTAAIMASGFSDPLAPPGFLSQVESWNGTSWTEIAEVNTARSQLASKNAGSSTAGLIFGGSIDGSAGQALTESWNGTSWTELNDLNTARKNLAGAGTTNTAALAFAGSPSDPTFVANTESWNGTSWTEVNDMNTARRQLGGVGSSTSALGFGGNAPPLTAATEAWDGTSWTEVNDLSTARYGLGSAGGPNSSDALAAGGYTTTQVATTEEFTAADFTINTLTTS